MAVSQAISARNARVSINNVFFEATSWTVDIRGGEIDVTNFQSDGFADWIAGVIEAEIRLEINWSATTSPTSSPPGFVAGTVLSNLRLFLSNPAVASTVPPIAAQTAAVWFFPSVLVASATCTAEVRGKVSYSLVLKSKSIFTHPS